MFPKTESYIVNARVEKYDEKGDVARAITKDGKEDKIFTYDEAVNLTGHGPYSIGLLIASCFALMGMTLDMFSFPAVTSVAACDLEFGATENKILLSLPFVGAIIMAYPWGYIADTQGRRASLLVAMWGGFIFSSLAALAPHWIALAVFKFISVSLTSSAQSVAYTLIGESCSAKVKAAYFFILTSTFHVAFPFQMSLHYFTLTLDFSINLGFITFVPWRFLAFALASPQGISAIILLFFYESPKFLANAGKENQAVETLAKIWKRNRQVGKKYPVEKIVLNEGCYFKPLSESLLQSLWNQTVPLFKMPLALRTLQLCFLCVVIYSTCGGLLTWFPFLADAFITGMSSDNNTVEGLCNIIEQSQAIKMSNETLSCVPKSDLAVVWASLAQGLSLAIINITIAVTAGRRKVVMITIMLVTTFAALGCAVLSSNVASLIAYFMISLSVVGTGIVFSYFVDLYPTSFRGMAACFGVLVARMCNLASVNIIGTFIMSHCSNTFYVIAFNCFSAVIASCFLPSDTPKKIN